MDGPSGINCKALSISHKIKILKKYDEGQQSNISGRQYLVKRRKLLSSLGYTEEMLCYVNKIENFLTKTKI